jgi:hypothetical protein
VNILERLIYWGPFVLICVISVPINWLAYLAVMMDLNHVIKLIAGSLTLYWDYIVAKLFWQVYFRRLFKPTGRSSRT